MRIEAELDDVHVRRLDRLQQRWQQPLPAVIAALIDAAWQRVPDNDALLDSPSPLFRALDAIGFVGCIATDEQLSSTYKEKIDFSHKCGGRE